MCELGVNLYPHLYRGFLLACDGIHRCDIICIKTPSRHSCCRLTSAQLMRLIYTLHIYTSDTFLTMCQTLSRVNIGHISYRDKLVIYTLTASCSVVHFFGLVMLHEFIRLPGNRYGQFGNFVWLQFIYHQRIANYRVELIVGKHIHQLCGDTLFEPRLSYWWP